MISTLLENLNERYRKINLSSRKLQMPGLAATTSVTAGVFISSLTFTLSLSPLLAMPEQARSADSFIDSMGVNIHFNYFDTVYSSSYETVIKPRLQELGIRHARDRINLNQPLQDARFRDIASNLGIRVTLSADPRSMNPQQAVTTINQIGTAVEAVEGPNEYDISGNSDWVNVVRSYMQQLHSGIRSNPFTATMPIIAPSFVLRDAARRIGDLSAWTTYGNMHPYSPYGPEDVGNQLIVGQDPQWNLPTGNQPMSSTEFGYTNAPGEDPSATETVQAKYIPRAYLEHFRLGVVRSFEYELIDLFPDPNFEEPQHHFGLLRNDGSRKPAFTAVKNLIGLLTDPGSSFTPGSLDYDLSGDTSNVNRVLLQKQDGSFWLVLWTAVQTSADADTFRSVTLRFNTPIAQASTFLPKNSTSTTAQYANPTQLSLSVPDHPLMIKLVPGQSSVSAGNPDLVVTQTGYSASTLAVGAPIQFTATVKNQGSGATPGGTIVGVGFYFNGQGSNFYYNDQYTLALAPGQSVTLTSLQSWIPTTPGSVTVQAYVDDVNRIAESNEVNNSLNQTLVIGEAVASVGTGLKGDYFNNRDLTNLAVTRTDQTVNFDWGTGSPAPAVPADNFSVRWSGQVQPQYSQTYTFYTDSDDGVRLRINGQLLIDNWTDHPPTQNSAAIALVAGQKYDIAMEYYEKGGGATARLSWSSPSQPRQIIPQSRLFPAP